MCEVKIYIETSIKGPQNPHLGYHAYILEYMTKKGPATVGGVGMEGSTTYNRSTLLAIVQALKRVKSPCEIKIYTFCSFIKGIYEREQLEEWRRSEWKKSDGEEVKNKDLWQQFLEETERLGGKSKIEFRLSKFNDYRDLMKEMIMEKGLNPT